MAVNLCFSGARGSRGTRQLKDFMGDIGDHANQQRSATGHKGVASDSNDDEIAAYRQPVSRARGQRGRERPAGFSRGRYSEMQQQYRDSDLTERPNYSNVRGRSPRNDGGSQQRGYSSRISERRQTDYQQRDDQYHPEINRGPGKQAIADRQSYDNRQPVYTESRQQHEDWNDEIVTSQSSKQMEQREEYVHPVSVRAPDDKMSARSAVHDDHRVSDSVVRYQQQEDKYVARQPPRRMHQTRTISNSQHHAADNIPRKDRTSQIGGIVDAMNRISVKTATDDKRVVSNTQQNVAARSAMIVSGTHHRRETDAFDQSNFTERPKLSSIAILVCLS